MNFILQNLIAALLPVGVDAVKQVIGKYASGTIRPSNVADQIQLDNSNVEKIKALAALDNPYGTPSQWVVDLRASFRYLAAGIVIVSGISLQFANLEATFKIAALDFAGMAFSFVFEIGRAHV